MNRDTDDYRRGYSYGKALGSGLFRIGAIRDEQERVRLLAQEAEEDSERDYYAGIREALKTRENEIRKAWKV